MSTENMSAFGRLRRRTSALVPLLALAVIFAAVFVAVRTEAWRLQMTVVPAGGRAASALSSVALADTRFTSATTPSESDSDYRVDRAYFRALRSADVSDYRADRAYLHAQGIEK